MDEVGQFYANINIKADVSSLHRSAGGLLGIWGPPGSDSHGLCDMAARFTRLLATEAVSERFIRRLSVHTSSQRSYIAVDTSGRKTMQ
jgi:hypothetical protein